MSSEYSFYKKVYSKGCPGCDRIEPQPVGLAIVLETEYFRVHQDYVLPIPGMMVVESKRHVNNPEGLSEDEKQEFAIVWSRVSQAVRSFRGVVDIMHVLQDKSSHFHFWLLPVYPWMNDATDGSLRNTQDIFNFF